jgi:NAD+ synthase (glutamine-hydrolysing)
MKVILSQLNYHVGNFDYNTSKILDAIKNAKAAGADLIVFAELAICGYPPLDFLDYKHFIQRCIQEIEVIAKHCDTISAIVGCPSINPEPNGKNLFNSAYVLQEGKISNIVKKTLLPTYDVFDEYRWFESNHSFSCVEIKGVRVALTVCEDLWNMDDDPLYRSWPMDELILQNPQLMINIAASPFHVQHVSERKRILKKNVRQYNLPLIYVNQVGANTEILFDGGSLVYDRNGEIISVLNSFAEDSLTCNFDAATGKITVDSDKSIAEIQKFESIHDALVLGIRDYFFKMGFKKAILGLSGGIDSALVLYLGVKALGPENIHAVLMPSAYSSDHSISDSLKLVDNLGCSHEIIPIANVFNTYLEGLATSFGDLPFNIAEENIQSRIRGTYLMAISNKHGYILLNTSNKSELAVGYGTLYGDMCGGLSVIGDLYKEEVFDLCRFINRDVEIIPDNVITKPPSAELRPNQKDSDSLPPYDVLDAILFKYIEEQKGFDQIVNEGFDTDLVLRILRMVNANEWKRNQFAPILRVSAKAFGRGRRMPIVAKYLG